MANYEEITVQKRIEGKYKLQRILLQMSYFVIPIIIILITFAIKFKIFRVTIMLGPIFLILSVPLYFCWALPTYLKPATFKYVDLEYEYVIKSGCFTMNKIMGHRQRVELCSKQIIDMDAIAPYNGEWRAAADDPSIKKENRFESVCFLNHPDNYYCLFKNKAGEKCVCIFQASSKAVKIMAFHNRATVVTEVQKTNALGMK